MVLQKGGPLCQSVHINGKLSYAVTGRGDHPDIGTWVCDDLTQMHIAMKQHCMGDSWYALFMGYSGLKGIVS